MRQVSLAHALAALLLALIAVGCTASSPPRLVKSPITTPPASKKGEPMRPVSPWARRVVLALKTAFPGASRVRVTGDASDASFVRDALAREGIESIDGVESVPTLVLAASAAEARAACRAGCSDTVLAWTDDTRVRRLDGGVHISAPASAGKPRYEHLVVKADRPELAGRLAAVGLWPSTPGLEIVRVHADGTADVRALGYLNAAVDAPEKRLSLAADEYTAVELDVPAALVEPLRAQARSGRGKMTGPNIAFGDDHRKQTMVPAVGTCGARTWVSGAAVVVRGRAKLVSTGATRSLHTVIDVEAIEATLSVTSWLPLASKYAAVLGAVTRSLTSASANTAEVVRVARVREEVRRTFGVASSLLEIDAVLDALESALAKGAFDEAREALALRCRKTTEESALDDALARGASAAH